MSFNSYEELMQAVEERRADVLIIEVDLGAKYSQEYEDAKAELQQAKALKTLTGNKDFLADNLASLEANVAETKPEARPVWIKYSRLQLGEWAMLTKQANLTPVDQYEKVLQKTFVGVFGTDEDDAEPISTDAALVSSKSDKGILPGGTLHGVIQAFMSWQNSGGDVSIRPTKSGHA